MMNLYSASRCPYCEQFRTGEYLAKKTYGVPSSEMFKRVNVAKRHKDVRMFLYLFYELTLCFVYLNAQ